MQPRRPLRLLLKVFFCLISFHFKPFLPHPWSLTCVYVVSISVADLSNNNLGDYGARAVSGMLKENSTLLSLNLSGNHFTDESAEHLGPALVSNTKLQHLDISHNALGERAGSTALKNVRKISHISDTLWYFVPPSITRTQLRDLLYLCL